MACSFQFPCSTQNNSAGESGWGKVSSSCGQIWDKIYLGLLALIAALDYTNPLQSHSEEDLLSTAVAAEVVMPWSDVLRLQLGYVELLQVEGI